MEKIAADLLLRELARQRLRGQGRSKNGTGLDNIYMRENDLWKKSQQTCF